VQHFGIGAALGPGFQPAAELPLGSEIHQIRGTGFSL